MKYMDKKLEKLRNLKKKKNKKTKKRLGVDEVNNSHKNKIGRIINREDLATKLNRKNSEKIQ